MIEMSRTDLQIHITHKNYHKSVGSPSESPVRGRPFNTGWYGGRGVRKTLSVS